MAVVIREYRSDDAPVVRRCVVELQEFERAIDPRLRSGESMADAYWEQLQTRCAAKSGRVFVAEEGETIVGFVAVLAPTWPTWPNVGFFDPGSPHCKRTSP